MKKKKKQVEVKQIKEKKKKVIEYICNKATRCSVHCSCSHKLIHEKSTSCKGYCINPLGVRNAKCMSINSRK